MHTVDPFVRSDKRHVVEGQREHQPQPFRLHSCGFFTLHIRSAARTYDTTVRHLYGFQKASHQIHVISPLVSMSGDGRFHYP